MMRLRRSSFVHQIQTGANSALLLNAISQLRLKVDREVDCLMTYFVDWRDWPGCFAAIAALIPYDETAVAACIKTLVDYGFLTERSVGEEQDEISAKLSTTYGRDPGELLDHYRREKTEGAKAYWAAARAQGLRDLSGNKKRIDIILFGDCDVQMEADFLREDAGLRGFDLHIAATSPDDFSIVGERKHDAILVGALNARHFITNEPEPGHIPHDVYIAQARHALRQLRAKTVAPILIDNLPEPTVQPLGLAEQGFDGHRLRFRRANIALAELAATFADVYVTDVAATLATAGSASLIDDGQVGFTHMGSPGWMLQRPPSERAAVHDHMPDMTPLAASVDGDPYKREKIMARAHMDMLAMVLGLGRKKCVIVDLDHTLWPGVLAETGSPFAWDPSISGAFSYIGHYFGLHEALLCLKKRGILLACVSKNDENVVRDLWKYPDSYPRHRLLTLDDFVTHRINWNDKAKNIRAIADEVGFTYDTFLFIDDNAVERDRVRQFLPEITIWGENLYSLRRDLLSDPRLMVPKITHESGQRTDLVKAQLDRKKFRTTAVDENAYITSLHIKMDIRRATASDRFDRVQELFQRTTQFNTTGKFFSTQTLQKLVGDSVAHVFIIHVSDRFGDHGLVGAAVIEHGEITGLVLSCRVLGMGIEHAFMRHIIDENPTGLTARITETSRNLPVRNIYRDHGFKFDEKGVWHYSSGNNLSSSPV